MHIGQSTTGNYLVIVPVETGDENLVVKQDLKDSLYSPNLYGKYFISFKGHMYVHPDGTVRHGTNASDDFSIYPGWYASLSEVRDALRAYHARIEQLALESLTTDISNESPTQEHRPDPTEASPDATLDYLSQEGIAEALARPVTECPLVDASAQAISGGKSKPTDEVSSILDSIRGKTINIGTPITGWKELTDMSSDDMLDQAASEPDYIKATTGEVNAYDKDAEFGPDDSHIDPHQADYEASSTPPQDQSSERPST